MEMTEGSDDFHLASSTTDGTSNAVRVTKICCFFPFFMDFGASIFGYPTLVDTTSTIWITLPFRSDCFSGSFSFNLPSSASFTYSSSVLIP